MSSKEAKEHSKDFWLDPATKKHVNKAFDSGRALGDREGYLRALNKVLKAFTSTRADDRLVSVYELKETINQLREKK